MKYPALVVNKEKLKYNISVIQDVCEEAGVGFCAVTKCFCAEPGVTDIYYEAGVREFADSRVLNLRRIQYTDVKKWLLRIPMMSEVEDVVKYTDISLNSELKTIEALSKAGVEQNRRHGVLLMIDVGDLREGVLVEDAVSTAAEIVKLPGVELVGIGTNLNCYGGILPTVENLTIVADTAEKIENALGIKLQIVSGGNSGSMRLLTEKTMPKRVNNVRLGEVVFIGVETSYQERIRDMHMDVFRMDAQIVELKVKPSVPIGEIGLNAFGEKATYPDKGQMKRAIIACGRQDVYMEKIAPLDTKCEIIGSSSDHMIIDVTHSDTDYKVGDILSFSITYGALLSLSTSEYIYRRVE